MVLERITVKNLRVIETMDVGLVRRGNWIYGGNGAGKTSVLEAVYLLGRGDTFRKGRVRSTIREGAKSIQVYAEGMRSSTERIRMGMERTKDRIQAKVNGKEIRKTSELAQMLPVQLITTNSHELLERGPHYRRKLLDWGVFHVEHTYQQWFDRYRRALSQRNTSLRKGDPSFWVWDEELVRTGARLTQLRQDYVKNVQADLKHAARLVPWMRSLRLDYRSGWPTDQSLAEGLLSSRERDKGRGFTTLGIHKADLIISLEGRPVDVRLSRGQQKLVLAVLRLAQGQVMKRVTGSLPILLVDDFFAELDESNARVLYHLILDLAGQSILTSAARPEESLVDFSVVKVFHVEHGKLTGVSLNER